jgi:quercetin dioxygenase-like cupin family protein
MMKTQIEIFQENVKGLGEVTARMASDSATCGLGKVKVFQVDGGEARVWILHERESVSIAKAHLAPGTKFPLHTHNSVEVIVLFEGSAIYESGDVSRELVPGSCVSVPRGKAHQMTAGASGAWFSVTTVPREEALGYVG